MLKKTITYPGFDGQEFTEDFYFNLTKAETLEMELSAENNSLSDYLIKIAEAQNGGEIIKYFKLIVLSAFGKKSEDGRRFIKSEQLREEFSQTNAFSQVFMELATDAGAASAFVNAIVPQDVAVEIQQELNKRETVPQPVQTGEKTPAQLARERSEAALRGFQKPAPKNPNAVEQTDNTVKITQTAPPVLEVSPEPIQEAQPVDFTPEQLAQFQTFLAQANKTSE